MHRFAFAVTLILCGPAFSADVRVRCQAEFRKLDADGNVRTQTSPLQLESQSSVHLSLTTELGDRKVFALYQIPENEFLLQIIHRNDETQGLVSHGSFDKTGRISLNEVNGSTTYKVECFDQ